MSHSLSFAFGRHERLKSDVLITQLYTTGKSVSKYPLRFTYVLHPQNYYTDSSVKVTINASKKGLRLAVKRNRMKRILRELYRHHKHPLLQMSQNQGFCISLGIVYVGSHLSDFDTLERLYIKLMRRVLEALSAEKQALDAASLKEDINKEGDIAL